MTSLFDKMAKNELQAFSVQLEKGADGEVPDKEGRTLLMHAAIDNKVEFIEALLNRKVMVNAQDKKGFSALHFAAQNFHLEAALKLLAAGAIVDIKDAQGNTPLGRAVFNSRGRGEMIKLLIKMGANPQDSNIHGQSPVGLAKIIANYDVSQFFE